jgi:hypothetical protein
LLALLALSLSSSCRIDGRYGSAPYVHNLTRSMLPVQVRLLQGTATCSLLDDNVGFFEDTDFAPAVTYEVESGEVLPILERGFVELREDGPDCGAAIVRVGEDFNRVVAWHAAELETVPEHPSRDAETARQALLVGGGGGRYFVEAGDKLRLASLRRQRAPAACDVPAGEPIAWSGVVDGVLRAVREGVDGCIVLEYLGSTGFVCVPRSIFPFQAGDAIDVGLVNVGAGITIRSDEHELELRRDLGVPPPLSEVGRLEPSQCAPQRDACGSLVIPARLPLGSGAHVAGEETDARATNLEPLRVYLGRVQSVPLVGPGCGAVGLDGERLDLAILRRARPSPTAGDGDAGVHDDAGTDDDGGVDWMVEVMP